MKIIDGGFGKPTPKAPSDLAANLRQLADQVDAGEVEGVILAFVRNGEYMLEFGTSIAESIILARLLDAAAIGKMYR